MGCAPTKLTPRSSDFERSTSANRTFSRICRSCCGTSTLKRFDPLNPIELAAISMAALGLIHIADMARDVDGRIVHRQLNATSKLARSICSFAA